MPSILMDKPAARQVHSAKSEYIPVMYISNPSSTKVMLYFHGNAEDLTMAEYQMKQISSYCNLSVIGMEYPNYGLYQGNGAPSEEKVKEDAEYLYKFVLHDMGLQEKDVIVFGRSMGSGPACWLAGNFNPCALCVMSGFTSVKRVAAD